MADAFQQTAIFDALHRRIIKLETEVERLRELCLCSSCATDQPGGPNLAMICRKCATETADECERLRAERDELQGIVDRLPKTADGVPVVSSDYVWHPKWPETPWRVSLIEDSIYGKYAVSDCCSTREAAEAAHEKAKA